MFLRLEACSGWGYCVAASQLIIYGKGADIGWHRMRLLVSVRNQLLQCSGGGSGEVLGGV